MPPDDELPPLRGVALKRASIAQAEADAKVTVEFCLAEARRLLEEEPPAVFQAMTHIDAASARLTQARRVLG